MLGKGKVSEDDCRTTHLKQLSTLALTELRAWLLIDSLTNNGHEKPPTALMDEDVLDFKCSTAYKKVQQPNYP